MYSIRVRRGGLHILSIEESDSPPPRIFLQ